jgi:two-component system, cell cycle sensor histidine kinase and response regulator CckA
VKTAVGLQSGSNASDGDEPVRLQARALAHDFNNLLAAIVGHASYLRMITEPGSEVDQAAATIEKAAERARDLATQLHHLGTGLGAVALPRLQPVDLNEIAGEVVSTLQVGGNSPAHFSLKRSEASHMIQGDAGQLNQLVMNLAVNACEAMGAEGGEVAVETSTSPEGLVQLEIRDCGPGIPAHSRNRVFDLTYSTKTNGGGLGLAIVHRIAQSHGAKIEITDNQPRGTIFRLRFPSL